MPTAGTLTVPGNSGNEYNFDLYSRYANLPDGAGVYIFTKEVGNKHTILYVGQPSLLRSVRFHQDMKNGVVPIEMV